jgi:hypothetical protein
MPSGDGRQARAYAQLLGLDGDQVVSGMDLEPVKRFGHMGVAISGGYIWPGWSRSREIFEIQGWQPATGVTGADILRGMELAAEHGW